MISSQMLQLSGRSWGSAKSSNVSKLLSAETVSYLVAFATLPFLTRLYGPAAFGVLGIFMALSELGGKLASLRYDLALVLPESHASAWALYRMAQRWALYFVLLILLLSYNFRWEISGYFRVEFIAPYFPIIALMVLATAWQSMASSWSMRMHHDKHLAEASVGSVLIGSSFKLLAGVLGMGAVGLLIGAALQRWLKFFYIRLCTPNSIWLHANSPGDAMRQAILYREFPLCRMPQDVLNCCSRMLPYVLLAVFFGPLIVGFYFLAGRMVQLPFSVLHEAVRQGFHVKALEAERSGESLIQLSLKLSGLLLASVLPVLVLALLWGPMLCALVLGEEWSVVGEYASWIMVAVLAHFVSLPASVLISVIGWNRFYLIFEIFSAIFRLFTVVVVARIYSPQITVMAIALSSAAVSLLLLCIVLLRVSQAGRQGRKF